MEITTKFVLHSNFVLVPFLIAQILPPGTLAASPPTVTAVSSATRKAPTGRNTATKKPAAKATRSADDILKADENAWKVLEHPLVKTAMKTVMGNKYPLFEQRTAQLADTEAKGDEISSRGGVEGLYHIQEGAFAYNKKTQRIQIGLLDDQTVYIWGASNENDLSPSMQAFVDSVSDTIVFEAPNQSTIKLKQTKKVVKKNLNLTTPTGTYEREQKWNEATLKVIALPGNKLKFKLSAAHEGNCGEEAGTLVLRKNRAIYKNDYYTLQFVYKGSEFEVTQIAGESFGGMNVYADGYYKKIDDAKPKIDD
jgi:hypothetical protein